MELMDVYDENRALTGRVMERRGAWRSGDLRLVVHVCLFNRTGQLLIQQRTTTKASWPGRWDVSVGGGVDAGETSGQAAEREIREELGLDLDLTGVRPALTLNFTGGFDDFYLLERETACAELKLQAEEVSQVRWAGLEEVLAMIDSGEFIPYRKSFLQMLYDMRDQLWIAGT